MRNLPLISEIYMLDSVRLASSEFFPGRIALIPSGLPWTRINIVGLGSLTESEEESDGGLVWTYKLTARLFEPLTGDLEHKVFLLRDVDGDLRLLGSPVRPWIKVTRSDSRADTPSGAASPTFSATWISLHRAPSVRSSVFLPSADSAEVCGK